MNRKRLYAGVAASVLLAISVTGCSTRTVFVQPECEPAPRPVVDLDRGVLWDQLEEPVYNQVEDTLDALIDWGLENEAILRRVCQ
jgi:hypothetical protein